MSKITALLIALSLTAISTSSAQAEGKENVVSLACENNISTELHYAGGYEFISITTPKETRKIRFLKAGQINDLYILTFIDGQYIAKLFIYKTSDTSNLFLLKIGNNNNLINCETKN